MDAAGSGLWKSGQSFHRTPEENTMMKTNKINIYVILLKGIAIFFFTPYYSRMGCLLSYPVVSSLVLVVDPVELLIGEVLHSVLGNPLVRVTSALGQDTRNHFDLLQVNLKPLVGILELRQPGTPRRGENNL